MAQLAMDRAACRMARSDSSFMARSSALATLVLVRRWAADARRCNPFLDDATLFVALASGGFRGEAAHLEVVHDPGNRRQAKDHSKHGANNVFMGGGSAC